MSEQRQIILNGKEVTDFENLLDQIPHQYAKKFIALVNEATKSRTVEKTLESYIVKELQAKTANKPPGIPPIP